MSESRRHPEHPADARLEAPPVDVAPFSRIKRARMSVSPPRDGRGRASRLRRVALWVYVLTAGIVAVGVLLQAFSIAAYVRGAGPDALDLHVLGGAVTHSAEIVVFLMALIGYWGTWRQVGIAALLPVVGTVQVFLIGDTDEGGSWVNGLHGLFALVVLLLAVALAQEGKRSLSRSTDRYPAGD